MHAAVIAGLAVAGTAIQGYGQYMQHKASAKAERLRLRQVNNETMRLRREQLRKAQVARANAIATAYNQGAGESSALSGSLSQITAEAGRNITAVQQDRDLSKGLFNTNEDFASGGTIVSVGQGVSSVASAAYDISKLPNAPKV